MNALIALFALLAVATAVEVKTYGQTYGQDWTGAAKKYGGYGISSGVSGYGIGYPSTYGQQIYGQSYYNPITYGSYAVKPVSDYTYSSYGVKPVSDYTYGYPSYGVSSYGLGQWSGHRAVGVVQPLTHNTYSSIQPIVSSVHQPIVSSVHQPIVSSVHQPIIPKAYTTSYKPHAINQPTFTSYFHRASDNFVKPEINTHVSDLTSYKTIVQQPFVQQPFVQQPFVQQPIVQQPYVSDLTYKTVEQQPLVADLTYKNIQPVMPGYYGQVSYVMPRQYGVSTLNDGSLNYNNWDTTIPKVTSYTGSTSHVVEQPKVANVANVAYTVDAEYKK